VLSNNALHASAAALAQRPRVNAKCWAAQPLRTPEHGS